MTKASAFVHLHVHSDYSFFSGIGRIDDYVKRASELKMKHLALTDYGSLFGVSEFIQKCRQAGINPVVGCEVYVAPQGRLNKSSDSEFFHLLLYAKNEEGYQNLLTLTSRVYIEGFNRKPRVDDELLQRYHHGLIASSACDKGEIPRLLLSDNREAAREKALFYSNLFGKDNFYLEVMNHGYPEERIIRDGIRWIGQETGIPIIATNAVYYLDKRDAKAHLVFTCIPEGKKITDIEEVINSEFYFKNEMEMRAVLPDFPDAIENTVKLAERCSLQINRPGLNLLHFEIPSEFSDGKDYLRDKVFKGLEERYPGVDGKQWEVLIQRAEDELKLIIKSGFIDYFLIVQDYIDWAGKNDIPVGPGRGATPGSLVSYALKITNIDPIKYGLLFERFLNDESNRFPDIDVDFCYERRGEVIDYIYQKYGKERVAGIITLQRTRSRRILKDVAQVLGIPSSEWTAVNRLIPVGKNVKVEELLGIDPKVMEYYHRGGIYKNLFDLASRLDGLVCDFSTHACGYVISGTELTDYVPLVGDEKSESIITAFPSDVLESFGLVKFDFLGLKPISILKACEKLIQDRDSDFLIENIREDDDLTFSILANGESEGVFQFESPGMQKILKVAKPANLEHLMALDVLYRPGPMSLIPQYIDLRHGREKAHYPHPDLQRVLKSTYGLVLYQEQIMEIAQIAGGLSPGQSDLLRRAIGRDEKNELLRMKQDFLKGAAAKGYSPDIAGTIFGLLEKTRGMAFNKSHAAAYSLLAYQMAYCKAHYPREFQDAYSGLTE